MKFWKTLLFWDGLNNAGSMGKFTVAQWGMILVFIVLIAIVMYFIRDKITLDDK